MQRRRVVNIDTSALLKLLPDLFNSVGGEVYKNRGVQSEVPDSQHSAPFSKSKHRVQR